MLNCKETTQLASDRFERRLTLTERMNFLMHIMMCPFCRRFSRQIGWLHDLFHKASTLPDDQLAAIGQKLPLDRERLARALRDQDRQ
ncbi:MAG: zf-HC2 domain-containing protein [bacterium]|nr:zf-HC2 domain-containing protein [bacterium]